MSTQDAKMAIVQAVRSEVEAQGVSIREVAEQAGFKHPHVMRMLGGEHNFTIDSLLAVLEVLGLEVKIGKRADAP